MKKILIAALSIYTFSNADTLKPVNLNSPDMNSKVTLMQALSKRASVRSFSDQPLSLQQLSDLLWAANGINRPEKGGRTAASAINAQDIDIYVIMKDGAYLYSPREKKLLPVASGDFRDKIGPQDYVQTAPVNLILVSDLSKFSRGDDAGKAAWAALDAGIVSQNISLYCAAGGLATVPRAMINFEELKNILKLKDNQKIMLNHPVGYSKN